MFVFTHGTRAPGHRGQQRSDRASLSAGSVAQRPTSSHPWSPTHPTSARCCSTKDGVAAGLTQGKTVVDMSPSRPSRPSSSPRRSTALGCDYLDAPVSGGEVGAKAASLTIMVGGPKPRSTASSRSSS